MVWAGTRMSFKTPTLACPELTSCINMGNLKAEDCEDYFLVGTGRKVNRCSLEQISPGGDHSFELGRKENHWPCVV